MVDSIEFGSLQDYARTTRVVGSLIQDVMANANLMVRRHIRAGTVNLRCRMRFPYSSFPARLWKDTTGQVRHLYNNTSTSITAADRSFNPLILPHPQMSSANRLACECPECAAFYGPFAYRPDVPLYGSMGEFGWSALDSLLRSSTPFRWPAVDSSLKTWAASQRRNATDPNLKYEDRLQHPYNYRVIARDSQNEHYDRQDVNAGAAAPIAAHKAFDYPKDNEIGSYTAVTPSTSSAEFKMLDRLLELQMDHDRAALKIRFSTPQVVSYTELQRHVPNYCAFDTDLRTGSRSRVWDEQLNVWDYTHGDIIRETRRKVPAYRMSPEERRQAEEFWAKVRALKIDLGPNPEINFKTISTGGSMRQTTGYTDEIDNVHREVADKMQGYFINLNRKVSQDALRDLMAGRLTYDAASKQFDVTNEYVRDCVRDAVELVRKYDAVWKAAQDAEPGIYTLAHFARKQPRLYRVAAVDSDNQGIYDGFHGLVMDVLEARHSRRGRVKDVEYFEVACEFVRNKPFRVLPEGAPAEDATRVILEVMLSSPLSSR